MGKPVFIEAKDDGGGGNNWSYKSCKAPVKSSPPTNQHLVFLQAECLHVAQPTVSRQPTSIEGKHFCVRRWGTALFRKTPETAEVKSLTGQMAFVMPNHRVKQGVIQYWRLLNSMWTFVIFINIFADDDWWYLHGHEDRPANNHAINCWKVFTIENFLSTSKFK